MAADLGIKSAIVEARRSPKTRAPTCSTSSARPTTRAATTKQRRLEIIEQVPDVDVFVCGLGTAAPRWASAGA